MVLPQTYWYSWNYAFQVTGNPPLFSSPAGACRFSFNAWPESGSIWQCGGSFYYQYFGVGQQNACMSELMATCFYAPASGPSKFDAAASELKCPAGTFQGMDEKTNGMCVGPVSSDGCNCVGNPIDALTGNKFQTEHDYAGAGAFPLVLDRTYNSTGVGPGVTMGMYYINTPRSSALLSNTPNGLNPFNPPSGWGLPPAPIPGFPIPMPTVSTQSPNVNVQGSNVAIDASWRLNYDRSLNMQYAMAPVAQLFRGDNRMRTFTWTNGVWVPNSSEDMTTLTEQFDGSGNGTGFTYVNENDETERYDVSGKLLSITNRAGLTQTLQYTQDPATFYTVLTSVTDAFGRVLSFKYDGNDRLVGAVDPNGGTYTYAYDGNNNLAGVTYPDGHTKQYVYENPSFTTALTGIIDENGTRFATWSYDSYGNAISSEHAGGVEKYTLSYPYQTSPSATTALGATETFNVQIVDSYARAASITQTCGTNCTRTTSSTFDANGNIASRTDFNGNLTTYSFDLTRDLEISRTEASGTSLARTITTQWHPTFRLPLQITEPGRTTTFNYDAGGNLLSKTVAAGGSSRTWRYTYNASGQILKATDPRTDLSSMTTYAYDTHGNLVGITNAVGLTTILSNYDGNGRAGLITDPNGATTALTYSPRGWLTNKVVTAGNIVQSTTYSYDAAGQLTQVTLPDSSTISYTYDPAHRLTKIQDSLGNSINYTLDLMSNRTAETVMDPSGALTRQVSRIFDIVSRVQQVTGAAQ